jgi:hypothetical protein
MLGDIVVLKECRKSGKTKKPLRTTMYEGVFVEIAAEGIEPPTSRV